MHHSVLPSISACFKSLTFFLFFVFFFPLLFFCLHLFLVLLLAYLSLLPFPPACTWCRTSHLQMSCMLRSWSTRPLVRSWTMPSMTWHLCRHLLFCLSLHLTSICSTAFVLCIFSLQIKCASVSSWYTQGKKNSIKISISYFAAFVFLIIGLK